MQLRLYCFKIDRMVTESVFREIVDQFHGLEEHFCARHKLFSKQREFSWRWKAMFCNGCIDEVGTMFLRLSVAIRFSKLTIHRRVKPNGI